MTIRTALLPLVVYAVVLLISTETDDQTPPSVTPVRLDAWGDPLPSWALCRTGTIRAPHAINQLFRFSPDGKRLAALGHDGTIGLWDPKTGKRLHELAGQLSYPFHFSPDGKILAATEAKQGASLWDLQTGRKLHGLVGHQHSISCFAFSDDGKWLVSGSKESIRLWETASGKESRCFPSVEGYLQQIILSPDATMLIACGKDLRIWEVSTGKQLQRFTTDPKDRFWSMALSPDGKQLVAGSGHGSIRMWETATGKELNRFASNKHPRPHLFFHPDGKTFVIIGHDFPPTVAIHELATGRELRRFHWVGNHFALSSDGNAFAAGEYDYRAEGAIQLWDLAAGKKGRRLRGHQHGVLSLDFSPDGQTLASFGADSTFRRWNLKTGEELDPPSGHQGGIKAVAFSPDGKLVASCGGDRTIRFWDPLTGREVRKLQTDGETVEGIAFLQGGDVLLARTTVERGNDMREWMARLRFWDVRTGREQRHFDFPGMSSGGMVFCPDKQAVALGGPGAMIRLIDVASGKELRRLRGDDASSNNFDCSPDGRYVVATTVWLVFRPETRISLWDMAEERENWRKGRSDSTAYNAVLSPDGQVVASAGGTIRLWDTAAGEDRGELRGMSWNLIFSPDGKMLAADDLDRGITLWEIATAKPRRRFAGRHARCMAFSPDGQLLAVGGQDTLVTVWDVMGQVRGGNARGRRLEVLWALLADANATEAYDALRELVGRSDEAVAVLRRYAPISSEVEGSQLLRGLRLVEVLEHIGTAEAKDALKELAEKARTSRLRQEAKTSLQRLAKQPNNMP